MGRETVQGKAVIAESKSHLPSLLHLGKPAPPRLVPPLEVSLSLRHKSRHKQKMEVRNSSLRKEKMRL